MIPHGHQLCQHPDGLTESVGLFLLSFTFGLETQYVFAIFILTVWEESGGNCRGTSCRTDLSARGSRPRLDAGKMPWEELDGSQGHELLWRQRQQSGVRKSLLEYRAGVKLCLPFDFALRFDIRNPP